MTEKRLKKNLYDKRQDKDKLKISPSFAILFIIGERRVGIEN